MREIKFRAWDGLQFEYGDLRHSREITYDVYGNKIDSCEAYIYDYTKKIDTGIYGVACKVDAESIGQYTGLKDVNGKEIYEDDVVRCLLNGNIGVIKFELDRFEIEWKKGSKYIRKDLRYWVNEGEDGIEVIGNIYENPSLLKEKNYDR